EGASPLIRFGKRDPSGAPLIRFGRAPDAHPLIRFGKRTPNNAPFIRFGRDPYASPLIRFGKRSPAAPLIRNKSFVRKFKVWTFAQRFSFHSIRLEVENESKPCLSSQQLQIWHSLFFLHEPPSSSLSCHTSIHTHT
ncbi:hypothetical protein GCK32_017067, partial [Trichostrongylus colubriformis]